MRYISLFSGIEAATVAWQSLGFEPIAFSEIDPFCCALLEHYYPNVPNLGDITQIKWRRYRGKCDIIIGGSPCQSFSIAGNRTGRAGESGLMAEYIRAVREVRPRWFVWENVPGAFSVERGEAFRQLLSELEKLGYCLAWRVLDAQFFGVAQRRRRVFVVGSLGDTRAADVLFEQEGLRGDNPSSREKRQELAASAHGRAAGGSAGFLAGNSPTAGSIGYQAEQSPTLKAGESGNMVPAVVCVADDNARAAIDDDLCGSLKIGGGRAVNSSGTDFTGPLCARDYKGVSYEFVEEGKVICQSTY